MTNPFILGEVLVPQNMVRLRDDFQRLQVIKLEQNYRSTHRILHCVQHFN